MKVLFWDTTLRLRFETGQPFYMVIWATQRSSRFHSVQKESFSLKPARGFGFKTLSIESGIGPASLQLCGQALYRLRLAQVNNGPRENAFPTGEANFRQAMYRSLERSPLDTQDGFDLYRPHCLAARWSVPATRRKKFRPVWIYIEFIEVCRIHFSSWESFIGFYIWRYPISTILACLFTFRVRISWNKLCWKGSMAAKMPSCASHTLHITLYEWWIWSNYHWEIRYWALRTTTTNCSGKFHWP